jgi:hypothetical protein
MTTAVGTTSALQRRNCMSSKVKKDSINTKAKDKERYKKLKEIIENILQETDSGDKKADKRKWILWHFLYIIWWESTRATKRVQDKKGPARGLIQMEPKTLWSLIKNYILGPKPGLVANLAKAAGVTEKEMLDALKAFRDAEVFKEKDEDGNPINNVWPKNEVAKKVEEWLKNIDSFAIKLMRYYFKQYREHRFPPKKLENMPKDPRGDEFKEEHAEGWARWWKRKFKGETKEEQKKEKKRQKKKFTERAKELDKISREQEEQEEKKKGLPKHIKKK